MTGIDLSNLNLSTVSFKGIRCFRRCDNNFFAASFNGSLLSENSFLSLDNKGEISSIGHSGSVFSLAYSKDGKNIISGAYDKKVKLWSSSTKQCLKTFTIENLGARFVRYIPSEKIIISGGGRITINIIDSIYLPHTQHLPTRPTCISVNSNSKSMIFGFEEGRLIEFYFPERKIQMEYDGYRSRGYDGSKILCLSYTKDEKSFYSCSEDGKIMIHQLGDSKGILIRDCIKDEKIIDASISYTKNKIIAIFYDTEHYLYHLAELCLITGDVLFNYENIECSTSSKVVYNPKGNQFLVSKGSEIYEYRCKKDKYLNKYKTNSSVQCMSYSPTEQKFIIGNYNGGIIEYSAQNRKLINTDIKDENGAKLNFTGKFSQKGDKILTYSGGKKVLEWSITKRKFIDSYELDSSHLKCEIAYALNGSSFIACILHNNKVEEFDTTIGKKINEYIDSSANISSLCYSQNGDKIFAGSFRHIMVWEKNSLKGEKTHLRGKMLGIDNILFHPSGESIILTSEREIVEKNMNGKIVKIFDGYISNVIDKIFINENKNELIALSDGNKITRWFIENGKMISENKEYYRFDILDFNGDDRIVYNKERNEIEHWKKGSIEPEFYFNYVEGLLINGCTFYNLHPKSSISEKTKVVMNQYGANFYSLK